MTSVGDRADRHAALALMDSLAELIVRRAAALRFDLAHSESDCEAVFRLRNQIVLALGWGHPDSRDGLEYDSYDDRAVHVVAWAGPILAATARLVLPREDALLPTEKAFEIEVTPWGQVVDWGRVAVVPGHQSPGHRVLWGLLGRSWLEMRARGYSHICGVLNPKIIGLYHRMGLEFELLAPTRRYWTEERHPVRFDVVASAPRLARLVRALGPDLSAVES